MRPVPGLICLLAGLAAFGTAGASESSRAPATADDDDRWWAFGDYTNGQGLAGGVGALTVYRNQIIAGGSFAWLPGPNPGEPVPGYYIGAWDGARWHSLNGGVSRDFFVGPTWVEALVEYNGNLIAGGLFKYANGLFGTVVNNIARWDGTQWHSMGGGVNQDPPTDPFPGYVWSLVVYNGDLIASGHFVFAGGRPANYIARWDGTQWYPLGDGLDGPADDMVLYQGELIAVGGFRTAGGQPVPRIAKWDGTTWSSFGSQVGYFTNAVTVFHDTLISNVLQKVGSAEWPLVSKWDGTEWLPLTGGLDARAGEVEQFAVLGNELYLGGLLWGYSTFNHVARWNGTAFAPLGTGVTLEENGIVRALLAHEGSVFFGGRFTHVGGKPSSGIGRWLGTKTPVVVEALTASRFETGVVLAWRLSIEALGSLRGVHVERAETAAGPYWTVTSEVLEPRREMTFSDSEPSDDRALWYRLRLVAISGEQSIIGPVEASVVGSNGPVVTLYTPSIDPSDGAIAIRYRVGSPGARFTLDIFTAAGRRLRRLDSGYAVSGEHLVTWDGRMDSGASASRGTYFVRLLTDHGTASTKVPLLRR